MLSTEITIQINSGFEKNSVTLLLDLFYSDPFRATSCLNFDEILIRSKIDHKRLNSCKWRDTVWLQPVAIRFSLVHVALTLC